MEDYIACKPKFAVFVPHTAGRYQKKRFRKAQCPIVERSAPHRGGYTCVWTGSVPTPAVYSAAGKTIARVHLGGQCCPRGRGSTFLKLLRSSQRQSVSVFQTLLPVQHAAHLHTSKPVAGRPRQRSVQRRLYRVCAMRLRLDLQPDEWHVALLRSCLHGSHMCTCTWECTLPDALALSLRSCLQWHTVHMHAGCHHQEPH